MVGLPAADLVTQELLGLMAKEKMSVVRNGPDVELSAFSVGVRENATLYEAGHAAGFVDIQFGGGIDEHPRGR